MILWVCHPNPFYILKDNFWSSCLNKRIPTIVLKEGRSERSYNPETPSNFQNNPKATPLDDTPTEAGIGGACHLVKLPWLHPVTDTKKQ